MNGQEFIKDYLSFTRKERIGLLVIVFLIVVVILLPDFISNRSTSRPSNADTSWISAVRRLEMKDNDRRQIQRVSSRRNGDDDAFSSGPDIRNSPSAVLFYFDPNTIDRTGWQRLGLKDKTIHTIQNYLSKGGHFYKAEDLKRIYGLHPGDYARLEPYIKIDNNKAVDMPVEMVRKEFQPFHPSPAMLDINTADTTAFISLPGIGSKLAARIVAFRDKLGGFYSLSQVGETYGLPDSTFQKIRKFLKLESNQVRKININTATVDELKTHPYIKYTIAGPIIAFRNEHGPFTKIEDIRKVMAVTSEVYNKIEPYLTLQ